VVMVVETVAVAAVVTQTTVAVAVADGKITIK
jgi:hypothetical protein